MNPKALLAIVFLFVSTTAWAKPKSQYNLLEVTAELHAFAPEDDSFLGVVADTTGWLHGNSAEILSPSYAEIRSRFKRLDGFKLQSEESFVKINEVDTVIYRARILLTSDGQTYVINEEHRISNGSSYGLLLISELSLESRALDARDIIAQNFAKEMKSEKYGYLNILQLLVPEAQAQAHIEVGRARLSAPTRSVRATPTNDTVPACRNVDIQDSKDIRRVNETPLNPFQLCFSCSKGVVTSVGKIATSMGQLAAGSSTLLSALGVSPMLQAFVPLPMKLGMNLAEGFVGLGASGAELLRDKRGQIVSYAMERLSRADRRFRCLSNGQQVKLTCEVLTDIASLLIPFGGEAAAGARLSSIGGRVEAASAARMSGLFGRAGARVSETTGQAMTTVRTVTSNALQAPVTRVRSLFATTETRIGEVTKGIHENWRETFRASNGDAARFKPVPEAAFRTSESAQQSLQRLRAQGVKGLDIKENKLVQNINQPAAEIVPELNAKLNGNLARQYVGLVDGHRLQTASDFNRASSGVHEIWMRENAWQKEANPQLFVPYKNLIAAEQLKDLDVLAMTLKATKPSQLRSPAYLAYRQQLLSRIQGKR